MRRTLFGVTCFWVLIAAGACWASEPRAMVEEFFGLLEQGKIDLAYDGLFAGSGIPEAKPQAVEVLKKETQNALSLYGGMSSVEGVLEECFGTSLVRHVFILKSPNAPTFWEFFFYKRPKGDWSLTNVRFNDNFELLRRMQ